MRCEKRKIIPVRTESSMKTCVIVNFSCALPNITTKSCALYVGLFFRRIFTRQVNSVSTGHCWKSQIAGVQSLLTHKSTTALSFLPQFTGQPTPGPLSSTPRRLPRIPVIYTFPPICQDVLIPAQLDILWIFANYSVLSLPSKEGKDRR